jgi:CBS domain-containing protein
MSVGRMCSRVVATAGAEETVAEGAGRMAEFGVGSLVVIEDDRTPVGILTDRDVALRIVGAGKDPTDTLLSQVMSSPVRTVHESTPLEEALESMEKLGVRRLVVTGDGGGLVGIFALDDALEVVARQVRSVARVLEKQGRTAMEGR